MKTFLKTTAALAALLSVAACATPYKESGLMGGATVSMLTPTQAIVSFQGNNLTSTDRVQQYVMLRAAELTHDQGHSHFLILNTADDSKSGVLATSNWSATDYGVWQTGYAGEMIMPKTVLTIEMLDAPAPGAYSAAEVINTIRPTLQ